MPDHYELIILGAGPCGLSCAAEAEKKGLRYLVIDKGSLVNTVSRMPITMTFNSSSENLEIGNVPFITPELRPKRHEALRYFRRVAQGLKLNVHQLEEVTGIQRSEISFSLQTRDPHGQELQYQTDNVVIATGYFDNLNLLGVPGEELPKVTHYYTESHRYWNSRTLVVGGGNSAVEAALDLFRNGCDVTLAHRGSEVGQQVKPWILPDIRARLDKEEIPAYFNTEVVEIGPAEVVLTQRGQRVILPNDYVLALTGYRPDHAMLKNLGVGVDEMTGAPDHDAETMESNVPGLYIAGVLAAGYNANKIFIENGKHHGPKIVAHVLAGRL